MMSRYLLLTAAAASVALFSLTAPPARAQQLKIAVVNVDQLSKDYGALADKQKQLDAMRRSASDLLQSVSQYTFLPQDSFQQVIQILRMPQPLPKDKQDQLNSLLKISSQKDQQYLSLQSKTNRTPEEENTFNTLQELSQARQADIKTLEQQLLNEMMTKQRSYQDQLMGEVRVAIAQVAKAKKYDLVLDSVGVFYGGDDITDAVLAVLNKGVKGTAAPTAAPTPAQPAPAATNPPAGEGGAKTGK